MKKIRIVIADHHELGRVGMRLLIEKQPGLEVCGEAADGSEAVALVLQCHPDVVVLDMVMPKLSGLDAARQIRQNLPDVELVMVSAYADDELVHEVFGLGARSYVRKLEASTYLVPAVQSAHAHAPFFTSPEDEILFTRAMQAKSSERADGA